MTRDLIEAIVRTLLQMAGSYLIGKGLVSEDSWIQISGGAVAGVGVIWMLWARWNTRKVAA